jgi:hypothetical protein
MIIHGIPLTSIQPERSAEPRFWYWFGATGRRYIHSVYPANCCPPLPGAVFVAVKRTGTLRTALAVGRFSVFWDWSAVPDVGVDADELHVHLLARDDDEAEVIAADLTGGLAEALPSRSAPAPVPRPAFQGDDRGCQARADAQRC